MGAQLGLIDYSKFYYSQVKVCLIHFGGVGVVSDECLYLFGLTAG